jgi:hypothetical protein
MTAERMWKEEAYFVVYNSAAARMYLYRALARIGRHEV